MKKMTPEELKMAQHVAMHSARNADGIRACDAIEEHLAALKVEIAAARDAALEEAAMHADKEAEAYVVLDDAESNASAFTACRDVAFGIRTLKSQPAQEASCDVRKECTCVGSCRGPEGLGEAWRCALGKEKAPPPARIVPPLPGSLEEVKKGLGVEMASEENGLLPKKRRSSIPSCGHARCLVDSSGEESHAGSCPNFGVR